MSSRKKNASRFYGDLSFGKKNAFVATSIRYPEDKPQQVWEDKMWNRTNSRDGQRQERNGPLNYHRSHEHKKAPSLPCPIKTTEPRMPHGLMRNANGDSSILAWFLTMIAKEN